MDDERRFGFLEFLVLLMLLGVAGAARGWYLYECVDQGYGEPVLRVQGPTPRLDYPADTVLRGQKKPTELDNLVHNLDEHKWYGSLAPLSDREEQTAHTAPGYAWVFASVAKFNVDVNAAMRWGQMGLGVLTVLAYYFFARRAFGSSFVAFLTGLLCALHPFWILNTAELNDGVLTTFLLGAALMLGARAGQAGGAITSLAYGLSLAALTMVRAILLPFTVIALIWFLVRCRNVKLGWLCALLGFLGYANGLAPWSMRNYNLFEEPVPVATSAYYHLWMGNNPRATGGYLDESTMRAADVIEPDRLKALLDEPNQAKRYTQLSWDVLDEMKANPRGTVTRRIDAGLFFLLGEDWFRSHRLMTHTPISDQNETTMTEPPAWFLQTAEIALPSVCLAMVLLGLLGWRWSMGWREHSRLAAIALIWIPLPYILSHAGPLSGPRLPLDGVLLSFTAFAICCINPAVMKRPRSGDSKKKRKNTGA